MAQKNKYDNIEVPERDYLIIPEHDRHDIEAYKKWDAELMKKLSEYWIGRSVRYRKDGTIKKIKDITLYPSDVPFKNCLLTGFLLEGDTWRDALCPFDSYWYSQLIEIVP